MLKIENALRTLRLGAVMDELEVQDAVAEALAKADIPFKREALCGKACRVDFLLEGGRVIEVKAGRRPRSVLIAQLTRYAACETITAILLVTNSAARLPASILGKPMYYLNLKSLWGIAL